MAEQRAAPYIFISYASADRARILPLVGAMERAGVSVWIDREGIHGGENYAAEINDAIQRSAALVLMCSATSLASRNVKQEIALAWEYERPYVPLLLEAVAIPGDVRYWLTAAQWIEVLDTPEAAWLPAVLTALAPLGIAPTVAAREGVPLAGREKELALLRDKLADAKEGKGGLVLIGGEAGIGKTTLAEAVLHEAGGMGGVMLEGHCFDLAETPPYGPWIDLFARYRPSPSSPPLPDAFGQRGTVGAVANQMALFVQVQDFLAALGGRPVVLLLDDMHWADPASLDLLRFLARSVAAMPLLLLVTYRSDELTRKHPLYGLLPQLAREASAARLDLGRLDDDAVRALVGARYGLPDDDAARLVAYLQGRAEGNALFVGELLRALEEAGALARDGEGCTLGDLAAIAVPALLRQVIDGRLARLGDETQRLLAAAAIIGHDVPLAVWATVGEVDEEGLLAAVEEAGEARLLIEAPDGERVRFAHALIREALYEGVPATRRRRVHRRVGEALAALRDPDPDTVAYHFQRAGDGRAVRWLTAAGHRARGAYAWSTAAERYEAALALLERDDDAVGEQAWLRYNVARLRRLSHPREGIEHLDAAERAAVAIGDRALAAAALFSRGVCHFYTNEFDQANRELAAGADALEALAPAELVRLGLEPDRHGIPTVTICRGMLVLSLAFAGRLADAIAMGERTSEGTPAPATTSELGASHYGDRYAGLGIAYAMMGRIEAASEAFAQARAAARASGHYGTLVSIFMWEQTLVSLPYQPDKGTENRRKAEEGEEARGRAAIDLGWRGSRFLGFLHMPLLALAGDWSTVRPYISDIFSSPAGFVSARQWEIAVGLLGPLARAQGDRTLAWTRIRDALPDGPGMRPGTQTFFLAAAMQRLAVMLAFDDGDLPTAKEWLAAHDRRLAWSGAVLGQSEGQALWAQYHRQAGDVTLAREHAGRALAHATEPRQPLALLAAHRLLGELDTDAGRYEEAATHLDASLALAAACQAPYERALTLLAMAELSAAMRDNDGARRLLAEVQAICEPLGAKPALARADALVARLT